MRMVQQSYGDVADDALPVEYRKSMEKDFNDIGKWDLGAALWSKGFKVAYEAFRSYTTTEEPCRDLGIGVPNKARHVFGQG